MLPSARIRLACCALVALPAVAALTGCGTASGSKPATTGSTAQAKAAVGAAAEKTERSTSKVHVSIVLMKPGAATTAHYVANGSVGPTGGRIVIDRSLLGAGIQHEILERRHGDLVVYTSPSGITLPAGKTWLKIDLTKYGKRRYGADTTFFAGADQDPFQVLQLLRSPAAKVRDLGLDWLPDHTLNTRYEGRINLAAAAKDAGASPRGLARLRKDVGPTTQTIDVWVSKRGRVARVIVDGPAKAPDGTVLHIRSTIDFSAYGSKATTTPPPASKVEDYFSLFPS